MKPSRIGVWIAIGAGVGAAFGVGNVEMGPAVAFGIAAGVVAALITSRPSRGSR